jgi:tetratricopeptide (TPR) repeat protein
MINENRVLNDAHSLFAQRRFEKALFLYSLLVDNFPQKEEYKIYALFCDIALEDASKAIALFDYFTILKDDDLQEAIDYVKGVIKAYDGDIDKMMMLLKELNVTTVNQLDAINYSDLKKLIEQRGSFKVAFEDIMFSTKVAIESKDDFYDFVTKLIDNGFSNMAYNYLEGFNEYFIHDKEIVKLYKRLEEKSNEANHKE